MTPIVTQVTPVVPVTPVIPVTPVTPLPPVVTPVVPPVPPMIAQVQRFGFHDRPTSLVLTFDAALAPASAQNLANYTLVAPDGRRIAIASATYDAATDAVTLRPGRLLNVHRTYHLTVKGAGTGGITDAAGTPLDGAGDGKAGSDYSVAIDRRLLVLPERNVAHVHPAATLAHRSRR